MGERESSPLFSETDGKHENRHSQSHSCELLNYCLEPILSLSSLTHPQHFQATVLVKDCPKPPISHDETTVRMSAKSTWLLAPQLRPTYKTAIEKDKSHGIEIRISIPFNHPFVRLQMTSTFCNTLNTAMQVSQLLRYNCLS